MLSKIKSRLQKIPRKPRSSCVALPSLPNELVYLIFTFAASSDHATCKSFCLVSRETRLVVLPYLMDAIIIKDTTHWLLGEEKQGFIYSGFQEDQWEAITLDPDYWLPNERVWTTPSKGWTSPSYHTQNIWLTPWILFDQVDAVKRQLVKIFSRCPNVSNIGLAAGMLELLIESEAYSHLRSNALRITVQGAHTPDQMRLFTGGSDHYRWPGHPFFERITELNLVNIADPATMSPLDLSRYPRLSAISFVSFCLDEASLHLTAHLQGNAALQRIVIGYCRSPIDILDDFTMRRAKDNRLQIFQTDGVPLTLWKDWVELTIGELPIFGIEEQMNAERSSL